MNRSAFISSGNSADNTNGGGVYNEGSVIATNSTISGNTCGGNGGGIYNDGTASLNNMTISDNSSATGGGINNAGSLDIGHSIVADQSGGGDCAGVSVTDNDYNLDSDGSCGWSGPIRYQMRQQLLFL